MANMIPSRDIHIQRDISTGIQKEQQQYLPPGRQRPYFSSHSLVYLVNFILYAYITQSKR